MLEHCSSWSNVLSLQLEQGKYHSHTMHLSILATAKKSSTSLRLCSFLHCCSESMPTRCMLVKVLINCTMKVTFYLKDATTHSKIMNLELHIQSVHDLRRKTSLMCPMLLIYQARQETIVRDHYLSCLM